MLHLRQPRSAFKRKTTSSVGAVLFGLLVLSGCATEEAPIVDAPVEAPVTEEELPPVYIPEGTAVDNEPYLQYTLLQFAATEASVSGQPIVDALTAAGFDRSQMQVSFDRSKTGLVADSIYVSVQIGAECMIGQVVTTDRSVTTTVAPALTAAQNICLIGNTRPIDW